jgi:hypothetical protein
MHKSKLVRFDFLSNKVEKKSASPQELTEYHHLLNEWNQSADSNAIDEFFLRSKQDNSGDE